MVPSPSRAQHLHYSHIIMMDLYLFVGSMIGPNLKELPLYSRFLGGQYYNSYSLWEWEEHIP